MSAKTGQVVTSLFTTASPVTGSAVNADSLPVGTLYLNGVANAAAVTVTSLATGLYKAAVTMPTLAAGDRVSLSVAATVNGVTGKGVIWDDMGETATASDVNARIGTPAGASVVADIATRLATAGYTAPPSIAALATSANLATVDTVVDGIAAKTVNLPASPAAVGSAMTLTSPYDAAKSAAAPGANMVATNMVAAAPSLAPVLDAIAAIDVSGTEVDLTPVLEALAAVQAKTDTLGSLAVTVTSPVAASGTITVEQGDSYSASRSRPIDINVDDEAHAKGLDAENCVVYLLATQFTWAAASVTETEAGYRVRFEPTIVETAAIRAERQSYKLKACIDNVAPTDDDAETIVRGTVVKKDDILPVTP